MKKRMIIFLSVVLATGFIMVTIASAGGDARRGKYTYRKVYKSCMDRGEVQSAKPTLSPDNKTQAQWERFFADKKYLEFDCTEEWSKLTDEELENIKAYLVGHAADSPTPAKCK